MRLDIEILDDGSALAGCTFSDGSFLQIELTHEGLVMDAYASPTEATGEPVGTFGQTYDELYEYLERNA